MNELATPASMSAGPPAKVKPSFNRPAIKRQGLRVSTETRGGKFTRVTSAFMDDIIAEIENKLRQFEAPLVSALTTVETTENFLTGKGHARLKAAFNTWIAREIQRKVDRVRVGKSL